MKTIDESRNPEDGENSGHDESIAVNYSDDDVDILTGRSPIGNIYLINSLDILRTLKFRIKNFLI